LLPVLDLLPPALKNLSFENLPSCLLRLFQTRSHHRHQICYLFIVLSVANGARASKSSILTLAAFS